LKFLILTAIFTVGAFVSFAQSSVGLLIGTNTSNFFNHHKESPFDQDFNTAYSISSFYEIEFKNPSIRAFKAELQYGGQKGESIESESTHFGRIYSKKRFDMQSLRLNLGLLVPLVKKTSAELNLILGFSPGINLKTSFSGQGYGPSIEHFTDSLGNTYTYYSVQEWSVDETIGFGQLIYGVDIGLEVSIKIFERIDLIIQNKIYKSILGLKSKEISKMTAPYPSVYFNIGLKRNILN